MGSKSDQPELSFSWASPWTASTRCVYASVAISKEFNAIDNSACMHALLVGVTLAEVRGVSMLQISPISPYGGTRGNVCISKEFNAMDPCMQASRGRDPGLHKYVVCCFSSRQFPRTGNLPRAMCLATWRMHDRRRRCVRSRHTKITHHNITVISTHGRHTEAPTHRRHSTVHRHTCSHTDHTDTLPWQFSSAN